MIEGNVEGVSEIRGQFRVKPRSIVRSKFASTVASCVAPWPNSPNCVPACDSSVGSKAALSSKTSVETPVSVGFTASTPSSPAPASPEAAPVIETVP